VSHVNHGIEYYGCRSGLMRGKWKSMGFALNVSVSYLAFVAYKNLPVNPLKHDIHKNITPKFSSYVTANFSITNTMLLTLSSPVVLVVSTQY